MLRMNLAQSTLNNLETQLTSIQLSYSTAEIERNIFFTPEYTPNQPSGSVENTTILIVGGNIFILDEESIPQPSTPLTEEAGLFQIIGLNGEP